LVADAGAQRPALGAAPRGWPNVVASRLRPSTVLARS
jgi:hypothetical protein